MSVIWLVSIVETSSFPHMFIVNSVFHLCSELSYRRMVTCYRFGRFIRGRWSRGSLALAVALKPSGLKLLVAH